MATTLLEALASLGLYAVVLATLLSTLTTVVASGRGASDHYVRAAGERQLEQLASRAFVRAGEGPRRPSPLAVAHRDELVLTADLDGDGTVDPHTAERTSFLIRRDTDGRAKLLHRIGRQSMTVSQPLSRDAAFVYLAADGSRTSSLDRIRLVRLPVAGGHVWLAVPRRSR
jgi:hypothetical protein